MTYRVEILPPALVDIEEIARWYDEREIGLGADFLREVLQGIEILSHNPLAFAFGTGGRTFVGSSSTSFHIALYLQSQTIWSRS